VGEGRISPPTPAAYTKYFQREKSDGVYLQDQIALGKFQLVLGGRGDFAASDRETEGFGGARIKDSFNHFSPHLGFLYRPVPAASLYASYSHSFTYLPFNPIYFRLANPLGGNQTHGIQYEGGVKLDVWRNRLQATASYFYLFKDNLPVISAGSVLRGTNQLSRGAELDLTGQVTPNWSAIVSYAYDNVGYAYGKTAPDVVLPPIWNAPLHSGNLWTIYRLRRSRFPNLILGTGINYRDQRYFSVFSNIKIPAFTRTDAMVAWQFRETRWRLQFNVKDLTNHRYYETDAVTMYLYPHSRLIQTSIQFQY
jgi:iron complex outermembrane receptor protein